MTTATTPETMQDIKAQVRRILNRNYYVKGAEIAARLGMKDTRPARLAMMDMKAKPMNGHMFRLMLNRVSELAPVEVERLTCSDTANTDCHQHEYYKRPERMNVKKKAATGGLLLDKEIFEEDGYFFLTEEGLKTVFSSLPGPPVLTDKDWGEIYNAPLTGDEQEEIEQMATIGLTHLDPIDEYYDRLKHLTEWVKRRRLICAQRDFGVNYLKGEQG